MTTTNGTYAHNGADRNMPDPQHDDWDQVEKEALNVAWLFWTMQLMLESWGAIFCVLFLLGLAISSAWLTTTVTIFLYLLVGFVLTKRNRYRPSLPLSQPSRTRRLMQVLSWPLRQTVWEIERYILATSDAAPSQQLDGSDIQFHLFIIIVKWVNAWMLVTVFIPVSVTAILEWVGS